MAYAFVQVVDFGAGTSSNVISAAALNITAGNRIILVAVVGNNSDITTLCSDSLGNTWGKIGVLANAGGSGLTYVVFECRSITNGGSSTISVSLSAANTIRGLGGAEYSGLYGQSAVFDIESQSQNAPGSGTDAITSPSLTVSKQPAMVFGFTQTTNGSQTVSAGTGFSSHALPNCSTINSNSRALIEDKRVTSTSATTATFNSTTGTGIIATVGVVIGEFQAFQTVTEQPGSITIPSGDSAYLQIVVTGGTSPTYQWQDNRSGSFANVIDGTGGTSQTYMTAALTTGASGRQYQCLYSDSLGSVTSSAATITVQATYNTSIGDFDPDLTIRSWYG